MAEIQGISFYWNCDRGDDTPNISDVGEDVNEGDDTQHDIDGGDDTQHVTGVFKWRYQWR